MAGYLQLFLATLAVYVYLFGGASGSASLSLHHHEHFSLSKVDQNSDRSLSNRIKREDLNPIRSKRHKRFIHEVHWKIDNDGHGSNPGSVPGSVPLSRIKRSVSPPPPPPASSKPFTQRYFLHLGVLIFISAAVVFLVATYSVCCTKVCMNVKKKCQISHTFSNTHL